jgi:hypothetical protein
MFLGNEPVPDGEYEAARITMDRDVTLVATGETFGEACVFDPAFDFGASQSRAEFNFAQRVTVNGDENLVVDFDLPNWQKTGALITPAFQLGSDATIADPNRHAEARYRGLVRSLSGGSTSQTFTLEKSGGDIGVSLNSSTVVYNENSSSSPTLSNSQKVEVQGHFDVTTNRIVATIIKIEDEDPDGDKVKGATSNLNILTNTVDVAAENVDGFLPLNSFVKVEFETTTQFFTHGGAPLTMGEAIVELGTGVEIEAEGSYSAVTNTLTANKLRIHNESEASVEARGTASNINALAGTFDVALTSWFGFNSSSGSTISVTTGLGTTFLDDDENVITQGDFFAALTSGETVEVEGSLSGSTISATKVKLEDVTGGQSEAKGYVSIASEVTGTITINLVEWSGFNGGFGDEVVIQTTGSTQFEDADGNTITAAEFFGALSIGVVIDARGSFSAGVLTATRARLRD